MTKQELIEDNMKLVYFVLNRYYPNFANDEDLIQVGMLGLCRAADLWDGESSKFSTYACNSIRNTIINEFAKRSRNISGISLETQLSSENGEFELSTIIPSEDVDFDTPIDYERFKSQLTKTELEILAYLSNGLSQVEIGNMRGVTSNAINYHVRRIRRKWREYNGEN